MCNLQSIQASTFEKYGKVLEFQGETEDAFQVVITEEMHPWRLAVFRYGNKTIDTLECHPTSLESFEPLHGVTVLVVAEHNKPDAFEAFLLNKPICLYKGIWHQVLSLTNEAQVKIAENLEVNSEFHKLQKAIQVIVE